MLSVRLMLLGVGITTLVENTERIEREHGADVLWGSLDLNMLPGKVQKSLFSERRVMKRQNT